MKTQKQFVLDTLLPYKNDKSLCGYGRNGCQYLTKDGKKCAVGKYMKKGKWQDSDKDIVNLLNDYEINQLLVKEALDQDFTAKQWKAMQRYHDAIALDTTTEGMTPIVVSLEKIFNINFDELKF